MTTTAPNVTRDGPTCEQVEQALRLVLAIHEHPDCVPPPWRVHLDPKAARQVRQALAALAALRQTAAEWRYLLTDAYEVIRDCRDRIEDHEGEAVAAAICDPWLKDAGTALKRPSLFEESRNGRV